MQALFNPKPVHIFDRTQRTLISDQAKQIIDRYNLFATPLAIDSHDTIASDCAEKQNFDKRLFQEMQSHPLDLAAPPDSFSLKNAHSLQQSAELWRSYHWEIAAHTPARKRITQGPLRHADPVYAVKLRQDEISPQPIKKTSLHTSKDCSAG